MTAPSTPVPGESLADAGHRIRDAAPIHGARATDEDCRLRGELIEQTLEARGVVPGERAWHTAQLRDGHVAGVWALSPQEAELELTVWWGQACVGVAADPRSLLYREYFPRGKTSAATADRRFPLGPPRRIRDRFAPAGSLLDGIWDPRPTDAGPRRR